MLSLGIGLGSVVNAPRSWGAQPGHQRPELHRAGADRSHRLAGCGDGHATYPVLHGGFKYQRVYFAMNATPMKAPGQISGGVLGFTALRAAASASLYLAVVGCFGGLRSIGALLCLPIATLGALAVAAPIAAYSATVESESGGFSTDLPVSGDADVPVLGNLLSDQARCRTGPRWLAWLSPLWHSSELARWAALGSLHLHTGIGQVSAPGADRPPPATCWR